MASTNNQSQATNTVMSFERSTTVTIRVGQHPSQKEFTVHESFIGRSEFFCRALNGNWAESDDRIIDMPEDDPDIFAVYLHLVYTDKFVIVDSGDTVAQKVWNEYIVLAKIYVLAEKLQDTPTKNAIIRKIFVKVQTRETDGICYYPNATGAKIIYEGTPQGNPIRKLLVDIWANVKVKILTDAYEKIPKEFLRDLAVLWRNERPSTKGNNATPNGVEAYLEK